MVLREVVLHCPSRGTTWSLFVLGDVHVGALNCAEDKIKSLVAHIASKPYARWIGGGDMCDNVILNDVKRFDPSILPDWILEERSPEKVRAGLQDLAGAQQQRLFKLLAPIKNKCLGLIEGNHEYSIMKYHNRDLMRNMCDYFKAPNLSDCAFMRLKFTRSRGKVSQVVRVFITHGHGGGRTSGAEPNSLYRLAADKDCDIVLKGHSHTFCIHPPVPMMTIPRTGKLPEQPHVDYKYAGNWGAFTHTYHVGPSTYASRANYPVRPMYTIETRITPFSVEGKAKEYANIEMLPYRL